MNDEFMLKVRQMREAQIEYFKSKTPVALRRAKQLEKEVDEMILEEINPQKKLY